VAETFSGDDFVPNDVTIGANGTPTSLLLTGYEPNRSAVTMYRVVPTVQITIASLRVDPIWEENQLCCVKLPLA